MAHPTSGRYGFESITQPLPLVIQLSSTSLDCDNCSRVIEGVRYKCTTCPNYNLCESCIIENDRISSVGTHVVENCGVEGYQINIIENCGIEDEHADDPILKDSKKANEDSSSQCRHESGHIFLRIPQSNEQSK
jgi:hypothetical protein